MGLRDRIHTLAGSGQRVVSDAAFGRRRCFWQRITGAPPREQDGLTANHIPVPLSVQFQLLRPHGRWKYGTNRIAVFGKPGCWKGLRCIVCGLSQRRAYRCFISNDTFQNYLLHNNGDGTFSVVGVGASLTGAQTSHVRLRSEILAIWRSPEARCRSSSGTRPFGHNDPRHVRCRMPPEWLGSGNRAPAT